MPRIKRYARPVRKCRRGMTGGTENLALRINKWPRKTGPFVISRVSSRVLERKRQRRERLIRRVLEAETGEVAVADRDLRAAHQEAVEGRQQATEQGAGGDEADGGGLGHCDSLFIGTDKVRFVIRE